MDIRKRINEAKGVEVYKALLTILSTFTEKYPASSVDRLLDLMIEKGARILPKDKRALDILAYAGCCEGVSNLLNMRLADLPVELRPVSKAGLRHETAFWGRGDQIYDKVKDLINFDGKGSEKWCDADGKKVTLLKTANEGKVKEEMDSDYHPGPGEPGTDARNALADMEQLNNDVLELMVDFLKGVGKPPMEISRENINNEVTINIADEITDALAKFALARGYNVVDAHDEEYDNEE